MASSSWASSTPVGGARLLLMNSHIAKALVLVPWIDRLAAEDAASRIRHAYPTGGLVVTDGEAGAYLDPRTGETGYRVVLRGPWVIESQSDGEVVLRCRTTSDALPASTKDEHE